MLKLRREHVDALRPVARAQIPKRILADLKGRGISAGLQPQGDLSVRDSRGQETLLSFNSDGLPAHLTKPSGARHNFEYDDIGRLTAQTWPGGERLEIYRDPKGRVAELRRPSLLSYQCAYDQDDRLAGVTYPDGSRTFLHYDQTAEGNSATTLTDRLGGKTTYVRDSESRLLSISDPLGRTFLCRRSPEGHLQALQFPDGTEERYSYDPDLRSGLITARDGSSICQIEDDAGRVIGVFWEDGSFVEVKYGAGGEVAEAINSSGRIKRTLDSAGHLISENDLFEGETCLDYDEDGRLCRICPPAAEPVHIEYDRDGQISCIRDWQGRENRFIYSPDGMVVEIRYGNNLIERREHARVGRLACAEVVDIRGKLVSRQAYTYDLCERLCGLEEGWGESRHSRNLTYDSEGRITREIDASSRRVLQQFAYDAKGNLVRSGSTDIRIGALDEPISFGSKGIKWDALGRALEVPGKIGTVICDFSDNGTLRKASCAGRIVTFEYDALGRRTLKEDDARIWRYGWAAHQLLWEEWEDKKTGQRIRRDYLWLPGEFVPIAFREQGRTYWLQSDARGAVIRAFDERGCVAWEAVYDSFGLAEIRGEIRQPWRLAGHYHDDETGLHYNLTRYYSPYIRSYVSRDRRWFHPDATNFSYARNDPWNRVDPFGTVPFLLVGLVVLAAAVAAVVISALAGAASKAKEVLEQQAESGDFVCFVCRVLESFGEGALWGLNQVGDFFKGIGSELWATVLGVGDLLGGAWDITAGWIFNPEKASATWERLKGTIGAIAEDPSILWDALTHDIKEDWNAGRYGQALGRVTFVVGSLFVGTKGLDKVGKTGRAAKIAGEVTVYNARTSAKVVKDVLKGIDPKRLNPDTRFGRAVYVAEKSETAVAEIAYHGSDATHMIRYDLDLNKAKVLDLSDPAIARKWGYEGGNNYASSQAVADKAKAAGFDTIKYPSLRGEGNNYAVIDNFDKLLNPQMVTPVP